jgi:hypothetical protein
MLISPEIVGAVVSEHRHSGELVILDVLQRGPNLRKNRHTRRRRLYTHLHHKMRRLHVGGRRQVLQDEIVALLQPQVHPSQGFVVERADPQQAQAAVVDVQNLEGNSQKRYRGAGHSTCETPVRYLEHLRAWSGPLSGNVAGNISPVLVFTPIP